MTEADFRVLLIAASFISTRFGQRFISQTLPFDFLYNVHLNQSYDGHATPGDVLYPADDDQKVMLAREADVVKLLYRDGRCPQWIDISVEYIHEQNTVLQLSCCGRFTNDRAKMYYSERGFGPFGIKSPKLPSGYSGHTTGELPTM